MFRLSMLLLALLMTWPVSAQKLVIGVVEATGDGQCDISPHNPNRCRIARRNSLGNAVDNLYAQMRAHQAEHMQVYLFGVNANRFNGNDQQYRRITAELKTILNTCQREVNPSITFVPYPVEARVSYMEMIATRAKSAGFTTNFAQGQFSLHRLQRELVIPALLKCAAKGKPLTDFDSIHIYMVSDKQINFDEQDTDSFNPELDLVDTPHLIAQQHKPQYFNNRSCSRHGRECGVLNYWQLEKKVNINTLQWWVTPQDINISGQFAQAIDANDAKLELLSDEGTQTMAKCRSSGSAFDCQVEAAWLNGNAQYPVSLRLNHQIIGKATLKVSGYEEQVIQNQAKANHLALPSFALDAGKYLLALCAGSQTKAQCQIDSNSPKHCLVPWQQLLELSTYSGELNLHLGDCQAPVLSKVKLDFPRPQLQLKEVDHIENAWFTTPLAKQSNQLYLCQNTIKKPFCHISGSRCVIVSENTPIPDNGQYHLGFKGCSTVADSIASVAIDIAWWQRPDELNAFKFKLLVTVTLVFLLALFYLIISVLRFKAVSKQPLKVTPLTADKGV